MSKKKTEKRWEWNVDYSGIDAAVSNERLADAKGLVLTPELVEEVLRKELSKRTKLPPVVPIPISVASYTNGRIEYEESDDLRIAVSKIAGIVEKQQDELETLRWELSELKKLLQSTLKITRKGSGF